MRIPQYIVPLCIFGLCIVFVFTSCVGDSSDDQDFDREDGGDSADDDGEANDNPNFDDDSPGDFRISGYLQPNPDTEGSVDLFLPAMVDSKGEIWDIMDVKNVRIFEDRKEREFTREPVGKGRAGKLDLMVVLDSTDSMDSEIASLRTSIGTFADSLDTTYDMKIGGISFRDWDGVESPNYVEQVSSCDDEVNLGRIFVAGGSYVQAFNVASQPAILTGFRYKLYDSTHKERPIRLVVVYNNTTAPSGAPVYYSGDITAHNDVPVGDWVEIDLSDVAALKNNPIQQSKIWIGIEWQYADGPKVPVYTSGNSLPSCNPDNIFYTYDRSTYGNSSYNGAYQFQATFKYKTQLDYDDGGINWGRNFNAGGRYVQGFTPPFYPCVITGFQYKLQNTTNYTDPIRIVVNYNNTSMTTPPYTDVYYSGNMDLSGPANTWLDVDLSNVSTLKNNPITTGKFWIGYEWQTEMHGPALAGDGTRLSPHAIDDIWFSYSYMDYYNQSGYRGTWMIRPILARVPLSAANASKDDTEFVNLNRNQTFFDDWLSGIWTNGGEDGITEGTLSAVAEAWLKAGWRTGAALERYLVITDAPMHQMWDPQFNSEHGVTWLMDDICDMFDSSAQIEWGPEGTGRNGHAWVVSPNTMDRDNDGLLEYYDNSIVSWIEDFEQGTGQYPHQNPKTLGSCAGQWINLGNGSFSIVADRLTNELNKGGFLTFESEDPDAYHDVTVFIELDNGEFAKHTWKNVHYPPVQESYEDDTAEEGLVEIEY